MDKNQDNLTQAFWTLGDWFSRLGGSARYPGFRESDIPLFIVVALAEQLDIVLPFKTDHVDQRFREAAAPVLPRVKEHIGRIRPSAEESLALLTAFVDYADETIKRMHDEDSRGWNLLVTATRKLNAQSGKGEL